MSKPHFLVPFWLHVFVRHGRLGLLSLLYMRRRLEAAGIYPTKVGDSTILQLFRQRQAGWHKPMKWDAGADDYRMHSPEGVKAWLDRDLSDFKRLCAGETGDRLPISHAHAAMVRTGRLETLTP